MTPEEYEILFGEPMSVRGAPASEPQPPVQRSGPMEGDRFSVGEHPHLPGPSITAGYTENSSAGRGSPLRRALLVVPTVAICVMAGWAWVSEDGGTADGVRRQVGAPNELVAATLDSRTTTTEAPDARAVIEPETEVLGTVVQSEVQE